MERYPVLTATGRLVGWVLTGGDFVAVYSASGELVKLIYFPSPEYGVDVTEFARSGVVVSPADVVLHAWRYLEDIPWPLGYAAGSTLEYTLWLRDRLLEEGVKGRRVQVNFSGGKDSVAALLAVKGASEWLDLEVEAVYVYFPYLETIESRRFAEWALRRSGVEYELLEADREYIKRRLLERGLPYRGARWCTYQKLRPIKILKRTRRPDHVAQGERLLEAWKRFKRLSGITTRRVRITTGAMMRPVYPTTLLDVARFARGSGLVHPDYLRGWPRVACLLCPYRGLHEIPREWDKLIEDPGLVEEAMRVHYRVRGYKVPLEAFMEMHLWRYHPAEARRVYALSRSLPRGLEEVPVERVEEMFRSLWVNPLPTARVWGPDEAARVLINYAYPRFEEVKERAEKLQARREAGAAEALA